MQKVECGKNGVKVATWKRSMKGATWKKQRRKSGSVKGTTTLEEQHCMRSNNARKAVQKVEHGRNSVKATT